MQQRTKRIMTVATGALRRRLTEVSHKRLDCSDQALDELRRRLDACLTQHITKDGAVLLTQFAEVWRTLATAGAFGRPLLLHLWVPLGSATRVPSFGCVCYQFSRAPPNAHSHAVGL
jgi:hypothetical protein